MIAIDSRLYDEYSALRLGGRPVPDDLRVLIAMQQNRVVKKRHYADPLEQLDVAIIMPQENPSLLAGDYLTAKDMEDLGTRAKVWADREVFAHIGFVARLVDDNDELIGYWWHPDEAPGPPPLVRYDSEGQFHLIRGATATEALLIEISESLEHDEEEYEQIRRWFAEDYSLAVAPYAQARELPWPTPAVSPQELNARLQREEYGRLTS